MVARGGPEEGCGSAGACDTFAMEVAYSGAVVGPGGLLAVPVADCSVTPAEFFARFVATRTPALIRGHFADKQWLLSRDWSLDWFDSVAPAAEIKVEVRKDSAAGFGEGREVCMNVRELCRQLRAGKETLYMTTQDLEYDSDGRPRVVGSPVTLLTDHFPLRPALAGHLVPANINLWVGASRDGASSGLHHDFHDNFYCLLRGKKRFRLLSPADTPLLRAVGSITRVHPNGRIEYEGEPVNADGSCVGADVAMEASERQLRAARDLEFAQSSADPSDPASMERLRAAEAAMEAAMDEMLMAEEGSFSSEEDEPGGGLTDWEHEDVEVDDDEAAAAMASLLDQAASRSKRARSDDPADSVPAAKHPKFAPDSLPAAQPPPKNFSKINLDFSPLPSGVSMLEVEVHAGDILYLPCGWFHEVTSFNSPIPATGAPPSSSPTASACLLGHQQTLDLLRAAERSGDRGVAYHAAFNFWFHPPTTSDFASPYSSSFWERDWCSAVRGE
jgi:hypothetical protein